MKSQGKLWNFNLNISWEPCSLYNMFKRHVSPQFGFLGLVEEEWIATLATIDADDITFLDYVTEGRRLAIQLKEQVNTTYLLAPIILAHKVY